jgi:hypothetical protein
MKKPKKWKPEIGEVYWYVILNDYFCYTDCERLSAECERVNYIFKTKREAEAVARKIKKLLKESVK